MKHQPLPYHYQPETLALSDKLPAGTVREQSHKLGIRNNEPLLVIMDSLLRYAKSYKLRFERAIGDDFALNNPFVGMMTGCREMLNADGAVAMELGRTTDSKDNGTIESLFWILMAEAGLTEQDLN